MARFLFHFVLTVTLVTLCPTSVWTLKILGISTLPSPSHHIWFTELVKALGRNGHEIYAVALEPIKFDVNEEFIKNQTTEILLEGIADQFKESSVCDPMEWAEMSPMEISWFIHKESYDLCAKQVETEGAKRALELVKHTRMDIIMQDVTFGQCFYGLLEVAQGNPSFVGFTPFGLPNWVHNFVGGSNWPAFKHFPHYHEVPPFNLWQRTLNFIYYELDDFLRYYYALPVHQEIAEKYIGKKMSKSLSELERNTNVLLVNSYPTLDPGIFLPPNVIEIGGLHIKDLKPLPEDIQRFLDEAEHGAIVISFGSNVKSSSLGTERLKAIVTALGQLKQRVLWKFDADHLPNKPENVMIKKWLPQNDALAHPKVRVLWSHGGFLSTQEAVWRGIPVLGMPFFMDQHSNIDLLVRKGIGLRLNKDSLTVGNILEKLDTIITDPSYSLRMKQASREYRDRPMSPVELAVWHVEYASRNPRGPLASPGRDLNWLQVNLIDVYAVLGIAILSVLWILRLLVRSTIQLFTRRQKTKTS